MTDGATGDPGLRRAIEAGARRRAAERRAVSVRFDVDRDALHIELADGVAVVIPRHMIAELRVIPAEELARLRVSAAGYAIKLDAHDIGISVHGLLAAIVAPQVAAARGRQVA